MYTFVELWIYIRHLLWHACHASHNFESVTLYDAPDCVILCGFWVAGFCSMPQVSTFKQSQAVRIHTGIVMLGSGTVKWNYGAAQSCIFKALQLVKRLWLDARAQDSLWLPTDTVMRCATHTLISMQSFHVASYGPIQTLFTKKSSFFGFAVAREVADRYDSTWK